MVAYWQGDEPAEPLPVVPMRDGNAVDLTLYATATATYAPADGSAPVGCAATIDEEDGDVQVTLPQLTAAGIGTLTVKLETAAGRTDSFDAGAIVVMADDGWHTLVSTRRVWSGAAMLSDEELEQQLEQAKVEVSAYAPALVPDPVSGVVPPPPLNYRQAQLAHTRNRIAAARVDPVSGADGVEGYAIAAYPIDWAVKQMLRPQQRFANVR